jgi:NAD(P)-dependent dehydrogenase (short-subunit alcohol dehydrogenase family)
VTGVPGTVLAGASVVVTGAGGGVGRGIALSCADAGAHPIIASPGENGERTAEMIRERGGQATWCPCDVTDPGQVRAAVARAVDTAPLAAVVHNAMSRRNGQGGPLDDPDWTVLQDHVAVTLRGAYNCAKAACGPLSERGGSLVFLASAAGLEGSGTNPFYATVKSATRGLAKSLAREWGPRGIRVNCLSVLVDSPAVQRKYEQFPHLRAENLSKIALGRLGEAEQDVGPVAVFLCGQGSRYMTGQTLVADGGRYTAL